MISQEMKLDWWSAKATELQETADRKDFKSFFDGLKIYGPRKMELCQYSEKWTDTSIRQV